MSQPETASPLLAEVRRLLAAQDALALMPTPMLDMSVSNLGVDPMAALGTVELQHDIATAIARASDTDLIQAYQETGGVPGDLEADSLLAEIERRNLNI
ncbi:hypothetical protein U1737_09590 [Sphingomonas sp. LB3N6]|uniref:hypothetical protein n=1 Tax=Sphingomonas fucosidasi TaxID=3096164 RepID=UPI002FCA1F80